MMGGRRYALAIIFIRKSTAFTEVQNRIKHHSIFEDIGLSGKCLTLSSHSSSQKTLFDEIGSKDIEDLPIYSILDPIRECFQNKPNLLLEASFFPRFYYADQMEAKSSSWNPDVWQLDRRHSGCRNW